MEQLEPGVRKARPTLTAASMARRIFYSVIVTARAANVSHRVGEGLLEERTFSGVAIPMRERRHRRSVPLTNHRPRLDTKALQAANHENHAHDGHEWREKRRLRIEVREVHGE